KTTLRARFNAGAPRRPVQKKTERLGQDREVPDDRRTGINAGLIRFSAPRGCKAYTSIMRTRLFVFIGFFVCQVCWGQKHEYDFYPEFRNVVAPKFYLANPSSSLKNVVAGYAADLK